MKKLLILVLTLALHSVYAQQFSFNLYFEDAVGNKDTLVLGYDISATDSIDAAFGEVNIKNQNWDSVFEVRCVNFDPDWYSNTSSYTTQFHTKKQIVKYSYSPPYATKHYYSDYIGIMAKNAKPPFVIRWDSVLFQDSSIVSSGFQMYNIVCGGYPWASDNDSIVFERADGWNKNYYVENNDTLWYFAFRFQSYNTTSINNHSFANNTISIYPNPVSEQLNIKLQHKPKEKIKITIYSLSGKLVKQQQLTAFGNEYRVDIGDLSQGVYFIKLASDNQVVFSSKFVKQ